MSRFGVGVITVGRRPIRDYLLPDDCAFVVVTDTERRGVAWYRQLIDAGITPDPAWGED